MRWFVPLIILGFLAVAFAALRRHRRAEAPEPPKPERMVEIKDVAYTINTPRAWTQAEQAYREAEEMSAQAHAHLNDCGQALCDLFPQKASAYIRLEKAARGRSRTAGVTGLFQDFAQWQRAVHVTAGGESLEYGLTPATRCWLVTMLEPYGEQEIEGFIEAARAFCRAAKAADSANAARIQAKQDLDNLLMGLTGRYVRMGRLSFRPDDNSKPGRYVPHNKYKSDLTVVGRILDYMPPSRNPDDWAKVRLETVGNGDVAVYAVADYQVDVLTNVALSTKLVPAHALCSVSVQ